MSLKKFSHKDPDEVLQYSFDFSRIITNSTETISSHVWDIAVRDPGVDPTVAAMLVPATKTINANICSQMIQAGVSGVEYTVSCEATTSQNQIIKLAAVLPVQKFQ